MTKKKPKPLSIRAQHAELKALRQELEQQRADVESRLTTYLQYEDAMFDRLFPLIGQPVPMGREQRYETLTRGFIDRIHAQNSHLAYAVGGQIVAFLRSNYAPPVKRKRGR